MSATKIKRAYSEQYIPDQSDDFKDSNTELTATSPSFTIFYALFTAVVFGIIHVSQIFTWEDSWTVLNMFHGAVSRPYI